MDVPQFSAPRFSAPADGSSPSPSREPRSAPPSPQLTGPAERARTGLRHLLQSQLYADDVGAEPWEFALDLAELKSTGLTTSDLRWLVHKGYAEHARETTLPGDAERSFRPTKGLSFSKRTCFVITSAGIDAARRWLHEEETARLQPPRPSSERSPLDADEPVPQRRVTPRWDADLQELRVNGVIVKQFKVPAPNQEMILAAFQEEQWPARIDDPLPPHPDQDPKRRLHDTIVSLNRNHKSRIIRFMGDGSGQGVRWTIVTDDAAVESP